MAKKWLLFKQLAKKSWIEFRRYFFNSMGGIITLYVVFLVIFMGYKGIAGAAGPDLGTSIEGILVGYVLWFLALSAYQDVAYSIQNEARQGTLEQLYMSVHNFGWVIGLQQIVNAFYSLLVASVLTFFLMLTTGKWLTIDMLSLLPLLILELICFAGVGFALGGLMLIFKRIDSYMQIVQFVLIFFVAAPAKSFMKLMPGTWGAHLIQKVINGGEGLLEFAWQDLLLAVVISLAYLLLGVVIYRICERKAMQAGTLGHY